MTIRKTVFYSTLVLIELSSCRQTSAPKDNRAYIIDSSVTQLLDKKLNSPNGKTMTLTDIRLYKDDKLVEDTYRSGKSIDEGAVMISNTGESIYIFGFIGTGGNFGYKITLLDDTCTVGYLAKSETAMYRLNKNDSLAPGVLVHCKISKLTLTKKPKPDAGEYAAGILELTSEDYYEVVNGKESKCRMQLTSYFKTNPMLELYMPKSGN